jgi:hypothetical protein
MSEIAIFRQQSDYSWATQPFLLSFLFRFRFPADRISGSTTFCLLRLELLLRELQQGTVGLRMAPVRGPTAKHEL